MTADKIYNGEKVDTVKVVESTEPNSVRKSENEVAEKLVDVIKDEKLTETVTHTETTKVLEAESSHTTENVMQNIPIGQNKDEEGATNLQLLKGSAENPHPIPSSPFERGANPVWFCLVASTDQEGIAPLPQIPSRYLSIKDGSVPILCIKKYIVNRLNLINELEVDITLQGQSLPNTLQLQEVIDLWLQTAPSSQVIQTTVGSSAKDVVMVLQYGRKSSVV